MLWLPFARERALWLPSPYLRGRALLPSASIVLLGTATAGAINTATVLTTTAQINPGDLVIVVAYVRQHTNTGVPTMTLTNSGTAETWTADQTQNDAAIDPSASTMFRTRATATHATGSTLTITPSPLVSDDIGIVALKVTPEQIVSSTGTPNTSSSTHGTSTAAAPTNATPTVAPTLGALAIVTNGAISVVPGGGWTTRFNFQTTLTNSTIYLGTIAKQDKVAINNGATLSASTAWMAMQALYELTLQNRLSQAGNAQAALAAGAW